MRPPVGSPSGSISSSPPERIATRGRWWTRDLAAPERREHAERRGAESARRHRARVSPARTSSPARAHVLAGRRGAAKRARSPSRADVFLSHDGVGARRNRRAGEDARDLARRERAIRRAARRDLERDRERHRRGRRGAPRGRRAHRVAVHRRDVERAGACAARRPARRARGPGRRPPRRSREAAARPRRDDSLRLGSR